MASPDHWQTMQITDAAIFYSRLTKWDDQFAGLPPHTISGQLYYTLVFYSKEPLAGAGSLVVDIGDTMEAKLASVRCYQSQFPPGKQDIFPRIEAWAAQVGRAAGFEMGEMLVSPRVLGTNDLMKSLDMC